MEKAQRLMRVMGTPFERLAGDPPFGREQFQRLGVRGLHCGASLNLHRHWLNTDLTRFVDEAGCSTGPEWITRLNTDCYYLEHDLTRPLPIADGALDWAFAEHFIEHITFPEAVEWLRGLRRMLRAGGMIRLSTPDLRRYVAGYRDPANGFFEAHCRQLLALGVKDATARPAWMMNQVFSFWGHRWLYDPEEVRAAAAAAGFRAEDVMEVAYRQGQVPEMATLDLEFRRDESLYMELRC